MTVDVWTYRISGAERCEELLRVLSKEERARYGRFHFERHRREFLCAHALLRFALSRNGENSPEAWDFKVGQFGKPYLACGGDLQFNLTHTAGLVACVVTRGCEVGVDVEQADRNVEAGEIAGRFFAEPEAAYIAGLPEHAQRDAFFRIWTLKEAYVKACGRGFNMPLREFWFDLDGPDVRVTPVGPWKFWESEPARGYRMAVAALGKSGGLRLFDGGELL